jgi:hypothetical protein
MEIASKQQQFRYAYFADDQAGRTPSNLCLCPTPTVFHVRSALFHFDATLTNRKVAPPAIDFLAIV